MEPEAPAVAACRQAGASPAQPEGAICRLCTGDACGFVDGQSQVCSDSRTTLPHLRIPWVLHPPRLCVATDIPSQITDAVVPPQLVLVGLDGPHGVRGHLTACLLLAWPGRHRLPCSPYARHALGGSRPQAATQVRSIAYQRLPVSRASMTTAVTAQSSHDPLLHRWEQKLGPKQLRLLG